MKLTPKAREILEELADEVKEGRLPEAIKAATFPSIDVPSARWSLLNRLIMVLHKTMDARGFRQWQKVGRSIKRGAKAFYILAPLTYKFINEKGEEEYKVYGFKAVPVFRYEDTEGEPLVQEKLEIPQFKLGVVAKKWGVDVKAVAYKKNGILGQYFVEADKIELASPEEYVFIHELCHAAQRRLGMTKNLTVKWLEITAELAAIVITEMLGLKNGKGRIYEYISHYAKTDNKIIIGQTIIKAIKDVGQIVEKIMSAGKEAQVEVCQI